MLFAQISKLAFLVVAGLPTFTAAVTVVPAAAQVVQQVLANQPIALPVNAGDDPEKVDDCPAEQKICAYNAKPDIVYKWATTTTTLDVKLHTTTVILPPEPVHVTSVSFVTISDTTTKRTCKTTETVNMEGVTIITMQVNVTKTEEFIPRTTIVHSIVSTVSASAVKHCRIRNGTLLEGNAPVGGGAGNVQPGNAPGAPGHAVPAVTSTAVVTRTVNEAVTHTVTATITPSSSSSAAAAAAPPAQKPAAGAQKLKEPAKPAQDGKATKSSSNTSTGAATVKKP